MRRVLIFILVSIILLPIGLAANILLRLRLPSPTGPYTVGRIGLSWIDESRPEVVTQAPDDHREIGVHVWYPAVPGTGEPDEYFPGLDAVRDALLEDEELSAAEAYLLPIVRISRMKDAEVLPREDPYPILIFSPGYSTNVEFYAAFAEDLASHGYVVAGINHTYDVAAVALANGTAATLVEGDDEDMEKRHAWMVERAAVRVADVTFVLNQLEAMNKEAGGPFEGKLDFKHAGILGHSVGGVTAAEACRADSRLKGVINMDGVQRGGIISLADPAPVAASVPFMFISDNDPLWSKAKEQLEAAPAGAWHLAMHQAQHSHFSDEEVLLARLLPWPDKADQILATTREHILAFFDQALLDKARPLLKEPVASEDYSLFIYEKP